MRQPLGFTIGLAVFAQLNAHPSAQHTDTQTTLRATSVAIGRIYAIRAMRPNNQLINQSIFI